MNNTRTIKGFTLAEVLITLGIIGVVAAMTLPTVINKYQEKVTVTKLKKFYSILQQSYLVAVENHGTPDQWGFGERDAEPQEGEEDSYIASNAKILKDILFSNVKTLKNCDGVKREACNFPRVYYQRSGALGLDSNKLASVGIIDGSGVAVLVNDGNCNSSRGRGILLESTCGFIFVDINGTIPPNILGKDIFGFYLTKAGIIPVGSSDETSHTFDQSGSWTCKNYGLGCTAWVIYNENLEYLKCDDLSWNGKKKCN